VTTLVLLHAFPVDSRMWDALRAELPGSIAVLAPDLCGFGRAPLPKGEPDLDAAADDVLALLDEHGLDRVVLAGCSMGGYVALAVLRKARQRVAGLALIDTRPDPDNEERAAARRESAERAEQEGTAWLPDMVLPGLLASGVPDAHPELVGGLRALIAAQRPPAVAWALRAMAARRDSSDALRSYDGPALVVVGERDVLSPPEVARAMARLLPSGKLVELPGCGHLTPLEAPAEVAGALATWLADNDL
jgi:pimeloyl-ACP methyl ester carboxylesterase